MDADDFWAVIDASRAGIDSDDPEAAVGDQTEALRERLAGRTDAELLLFQERLGAQTARANTWRIWAAGYLAAGGMSDDAFDYFRLWLVLQGRVAFEAVLGEPDQLADMPWDEDGAAFSAAEEVGYLVEGLLEERGSDPGDALVSATANGQPIGDPFPEDDGEWFAARFPRLSTRVEAPSEAASVRTDWDRITHADVAHVAQAVETAKERRPVQPMPPLLAADLIRLGQLDPRDRPMLAAYWLVDGHDGEALRELAGLSGDEREVNDLWPLVLEELGVLMPTGDRRAMAWAAKRVLDGERDLRWLVRLLYPSFFENRDDAELDTLIYTIDDWLDSTERDLRSRDPEVRSRAESARQALRGVVEAMAQEDVAGALRTLRDWDR